MEKIVLRVYIESRLHFGKHPKDNNIFFKQVLNHNNLKDLFKNCVDKKTFEEFLYKHFDLVNSIYSGMIYRNEDCYVDTLNSLIIIGKTVKKLTFNSSDKIATIYYEGTFDDWLNINLDKSAKIAFSFVKYFYCFEDGEYKRVERVKVRNTDTIKPYQFASFNCVKSISLKGIKHYSVSCFENYNGSIQTEKCVSSDILFVDKDTVIQNGDKITCFGPYQSIKHLFNNNQK